MTAALALAATGDTHCIALCLFEGMTGRSLYMETEL